MKHIAFVYIILTLTSCAFAPMSSTYTARTNGSGEVNIDIGANADTNVPYLRVGYGVFNRMDVGVLVETSALVNALGIWTKFGIIKNNEGFSWSLIGSVGETGNSNYYYAGTIASMKLKMFEFYGLARYNHVDADESEIEVDDLFEVPISYQLDYWQYTAGANLWLADWFGFNINATAFSGDIESIDNALFGGALLFRF